MPLGLFNAASSLGPAIAPPLLTAIMLAFGWRAMFVSMGLLGLVVAAAWWAFYRDPRGRTRRAARRHRRDPRRRHGRVTAVAGPKLWGELFAIPTTWAMMVGLFGLVYVSWLYVAWLPDYLERVRHVSTARTGILAALPQFAGFFGGVGGGYLSDWLARKNMDPIDSRKWPTAVGLVIAGALTAAAPFIGDTYVSLAVMSAAMFFAYGAGSCSWALGATLTPPHLVATLEAVQNIGGSIGGGLAPLVTGIIVGRTGLVRPRLRGGRGRLPCRRRGVRVRQKQGLRAAGRGGVRARPADRTKVFILTFPAERRPTGAEQRRVTGLFADMVDFTPPPSGARRRRLRSDAAHLP